MAIPLKIVRCSYCGIDVEIHHKDRLAKFDVGNPICCSKTCLGSLIKSKLELNVSCSICGAKYHLKGHRIRRAKDLVCSYDCKIKLNKRNMRGENNHQYGLLGSTNGSHKSDVSVNPYGYLQVYSYTHPNRNKNNIVLAHRLIIEEQMRIVDDVRLVADSNDYRYLPLKYDVHHKNENRLDKYSHTYKKRT